MFTFHIGWVKPGACRAGEAGSASPARCAPGETLSQYFTGFTEAHAQSHLKGNKNINFTASLTIKANWTKAANIIKKRLATLWNAFQVGSCWIETLNLLRVEPTRPKTKQNAVLFRGTVWQQTQPCRRSVYNLKLVFNTHSTNLYMDLARWSLLFQRERVQTCNTNTHHDTGLWHCQCMDYKPTSNRTVGSMHMGV